MTASFDDFAEDIEAKDPGVAPDTARIAEAFRARRPDLAVSESMLGSVEALLHLVDQVVPGWSIVLRGKALEPDGHWSCTLRETTGRDSDEYLGIGKAPEPSAAILAALLRVLAYQTRRSEAGKG